MKNSGLFLNMANGVFWVWFFWGFNTKKVCFWCVWHCFKSVKNACFFFPIFGAFLGWLIIVHLGLEGLGVFVFLAFVFLLCCFCFCFVCFVIGFVFCFVFCFVFVLFLFYFCFVFFSFFLFFLFFFGGFKGQVRWPKGPPHLALNPPYFLIFVFRLLFFLFFCCLFLLVFVFLFCFFGGFKGQVRWPKGPPHLALNPPHLFIYFLFCFFFLCLFFICF